MKLKGLSQTLCGTWYTYVVWWNGFPEILLNGAPAPRNSTHKEETMERQDRRMLKWPLWNMEHAAFNEVIEVEAYPSLGISHVAMQGSHITLWCLGDMKSAKVIRRFRICGTGHDTEPTGNYLGTVHERVFVWHIFELF
jgi:L-arabinose isomerase